MNAATELVLSLPCHPQSSSLDELTYIVSLFYSLPIAQIEALARTQNRNFKQMLMHLIEIARTHYPEGSLVAARADIPALYVPGKPIEGSPYFLPLQRTAS